MKVICGLGNFSKNKSGPKVVAVGVFDGVHAGHRLILRSVRNEAKKRNLLSAVVTFSFHPDILLKPFEKMFSLTSLKEKLSLIEQAGIDICYVINFTRSFADMPPEKFIKDILLKRINMVTLCVGEDFVFGKGARADRLALSHMALDFNFSLKIIKHLKMNGRIVSSSLIRGLLRDGSLQKAKYFLGRAFSFSGKVVKGDGLGGSLGFPTANIRTGREIELPDGVYATFVFLSGRRFEGATYIGKKPTCARNSKYRNIEVYLFSFNRNIYGRELKIEFIRKIRDSRKFSSKEELVINIRKDIKTAKSIFKKFR